MSAMSEYAITSSDFIYAFLNSKCPFDLLTTEVLLSNIEKNMLIVGVLALLPILGKEYSVFHKYDVG